MQIYQTPPWAALYQNCILIWFPKGSLKFEEHKGYCRALSERNFNLVVLRRVQLALHEGRMTRPTP